MDVIRLVHHLAGAIGPRLTGTSALREAADVVTRELAELGLPVRRVSVGWSDWTDQGSSVRVGSQTFPARTNPYTPGGHCDAPLHPVEQHEAVASARGRIAVVRLPDLALGLPPAWALRSGLFPFLEGLAPLRRHLVEAAPAGLVLVGEHDHVDPLVADPELPIPSVTVSAAVGAALLAAAGREARLDVGSRVAPGEAVSVIARQGDAQAPPIVLLAHLDTAPGERGEWDNASGVAVLLAVAERLARMRPELPVEYALLDGEELWGIGAAAYADERVPAGVLAVLNVDGVGARRPTSVAAMGCPGKVEQAVRDLVARHPGAAAGPAWVQGDHFAFAARSVPVVAITDGDTTRFTHAADQDRIRVDAGLLDGVVDLVADLVTSLAALPILPARGGPAR